MSPEEIKSGVEVISDFLTSLKSKNEVDPLTLDTIRALFEANKLSKAQLLRALEATREKAINQSSSKKSSGL